MTDGILEDFQEVADPDESLVNRDILQVAINRWGHDSQMDQLIEECAELIVAIHHLRRSKDNLLPVLEELADVEIMLEQMSIIFDRELIEQIKFQKMTRLAQRLDLYG